MIASKKLSIITNSLHRHIKTTSKIQTVLVPYKKHHTLGIHKKPNAVAPYSARNALVPYKKGQTAIVPYDTCHSLVIHNQHQEKNNNLIGANFKVYDLLDIGGFVMKSIHILILF